MGGEILRRGHARVQNVHVSRDADVFLLQSYVADHQYDFHAVRHGRGDLFQVHAAHHDDATAVGGQARKWRYVPRTQHERFATNVPASGRAGYVHIPPQVYRTWAETVAGEMVVFRNTR